MPDLKIASYNCKYFDNLQCKLDFMRNVFNSCGFLCIQEHWLFDTQFHRFDWLCDERVQFTATSAMDTNVIKCGRPHGGTAIVWKCSISYKIEVIDTVSPRISAIRVFITENSSLLLFNVYMPTDQRYNGDNLQSYQDVLCEISSICHSFNADNIIICGDLNTDFCRDSPQTDELKMFCDSEGLNPCVTSIDNNVNYTFEGANGARSLIDHFIVSDKIKDFVSCIYTIDSVDNPSDHVALCCDFNIDLNFIEVCIDKNNYEQRPCWYKASLIDIDKYKSVMNSLINELYVPRDALKCLNVNCKMHHAEIECFYNALVNDVCLAAGKHVLPSSGKHSGKNVRKIPGWNEYVAHKKENALYCHWMWKQAGRPCSGLLYENRKHARYDYHYAIKKVRNNEDRLRSEKMLAAIKDNKQKNLWYEVNKLKGRKKSLPVMVDGVKGEDNIANIFADKYKHLYTSVSFDKAKILDIGKDLDGKINKFSSENVQNSFFSIEEVKCALKQISYGKSDGQTGLFSDHILHGTDELYDLFCDLFNAMLVHCMTPKDMLKSTMIPIVKNKRAQCNNSDNFRAICLQSVLCKLLDLMVLNREHNLLITSELQFGFKSKHSTALATSVLLQTVDYYIDNGGIVYGMALDASKAFDRLEYSRLFTLLVKRKLNPLYIRLILDMYVNQKMCVRYNKSESSWFCPTNGVKQGGVLSPTLFAIYIDGMLNLLENSKSGCYVGNKYCGVIGYADDVILLSPTQNSMRNMIKLCETYADQYLIKFNSNKCQSVVFDKCSSSIDPCFHVNNQIVSCVKEIVYLGYVIKGDRSDPLVLPIVSAFNKKFNAFIGDLDCVASEVKGSLFQQYCTSLYGVIFSQLYHTDANRLCITWRKAMRRLYKLPNRTHCKLLPIITDILPVDLQTNLRFLKHMYLGLNHDNSTVQFLFNMCNSLHRTVMSKNFKYICDKYGISQNSVTISSPTIVKNRIKKMYYSSVLENDKAVGTQIKELVFMRDCLDFEEFHLSRNEICDVFFYLATD